MSSLHLTNSDFYIAALLLLGAVLYTSVGHAGSSVYIAIMSLFDLAVPVIKPTALILNIFVSSFASFRYLKAKLFDLKLFIPLALGAIPMAFLGGKITLTNDFYKPIVGVLLLISAATFLLPSKNAGEKIINPPSPLVAVLTGAAIGFLAGLTGTGGGIFLSPIALLLSWSSVKQISGTASLFILVNSIFGLLGHATSVSELPDSLPLFVLAVMIGALIGTKLGISKFSNAGVKKALGYVLIIAGLKLTIGF